MVDLENFKQMVEGMVPFVKKVGFEFTGAGEGWAELAFPPDPGNFNHAACYHAGALFTFGETVGGAAMAMAFEMFKYRVLVKSARIDYLKRVDDRITSRAEVTEDERTQILQELQENDGRALHTLQVVMHDADGEAVCEMELDYHIKAL